MNRFIAVAVGMLLACGVAAGFDIGGGGSKVAREVKSPQGATPNGITLRGATGSGAIRIQPPAVFSGLTTAYQPGLAGWKRCKWNGKDGDLSVVTNCVDWPVGGGGGGSFGTITGVPSDSPALASALNAKAGLVNPAFQGYSVAAGTIAKVPTAAPGTNTTQAASTAFVAAALSGVSGFPHVDSGDPLSGTCNWNTTDFKLRCRSAITGNVYMSALTLESSPDTTPSVFTFVDETDVAVGLPKVGSPITVTGINYPTPISVTGDAGYGYSKNGGSCTPTADTVMNGNTIAPCITASSSNSTTTNATVTIGGISDTYSVTTRAGVSACGSGSETITVATGASNQSGGIYDVTTVGQSVTPAVNGGLYSVTVKFPQINNISRSVVVRIGDSPNLSTVYDVEKTFALGSATVDADFEMVFNTAIPMTAGQKKYILIKGPALSADRVTLKQQSSNSYASGAKLNGTNWNTAEDTTTDVYMRVKTCP